jgi:hypothetical protein
MEKPFVILQTSHPISFEAVKEEVEVSVLEPTCIGKADEYDLH